jgi:hypothetical protein
MSTARRVATLVVLVLVVSVAPAAPASAWQRWPGTRITYYKAIDGHGWAIRQAVRAWNTSGMNMRFVQVDSKAAAQLVIVKSDAGYRATKGYNPGWDHTLWLEGPGDLPQNMGKHDVARIVTHELGHVLGLSHVSVRDHCSIMTTGSLDYGCKPPPKGMWRCRLLEPMDVRKAVRIYGGSANAVRRPANCYVYKVPAAASEMTARLYPPDPRVVNDYDETIKVAWRNPSSRGLATYVLNRRFGTCPTGPRDSDAVRIKKQSRQFHRNYNPEFEPYPGRINTVWHDRGAAREGRHCYRVWVADLAGRFNNRPATVWLKMGPRAGY